MPYTTQALIQTRIPGPYLNDALDDDGDSNPDAGLLDSIIAAASQSVNALLAPTYTTPFPDPAPVMVQEAAFVLACEAIYDRRPGADKNPWKKSANDWREKLNKIGQEGKGLDALAVRQFQPGTAITEIPVIDSTLR